ncbi:hypothetical protein ACYSNV_11495 [Myroides sp. LJL119]
MKASIWLVAIVGLSGISGFSQERITLDGRIRLYDGTTQEVLVVNRQTKQEVQSDITGYYMIPVQSGDTLRFSGKYTATSDYVVLPQDITQARVNVVLSKPGQNLEEIVIVKKDFGPDFFDLGDRQKLTNAEINFKTNNTLTSATPTGGLGINIGAVVNLFSGKRKADKQAIAYEKMQLKVTEFLEQYPKSDLIKDLRMNPDYVDAFLIYLVNQPDFMQVPVAQNEGYRLYLAGHYDGFIELINSELSKQQ